MLLNITVISILGFIAAAVDAIAGGGGLVSIPGLLLVGIPPHYTLGTNKFAATAGSFNSSLNFARSGKVYFPLVKLQIPFTLIGAALGVLTVMRLSSDFLNKIVLILILSVGVYTIVHKNLGIKNHFQGLNPKNIFIGCVFAFVLGFYDGFFGPGTGSFLIFLFIAVFGFDFVTASANSKVLNFISNVTSLMLFAMQGQILYRYGIPMALSMLLGSHFGTKLAVRRGAKLVKPIFITMSLLVAIKLVSQML